ncbi:MAG: SoxR reducing system RseC family protein [Halanaerobium sp.]|nr:SoxR reducing system RseC family protein [Halanaerobium sp.]
MEQLAEVVEIKSDRAILQVRRHTACKKCGKCQGADDLEIEIKNEKDLAKGDRVVLEMGSGRLLGAAAFLYIFPLLILLVGYFLGSSYFDLLLPGSAEVAGILIGLFLMGLSFILIRIYDMRVRDNNKFQPRIKRVYKG